MPRLIAFYLPQFHPVAETDAWWGKGFTEWTNTAKARPLFPGHYQPHVPADLGFYDLRVAETRAAQAEMAHKYGIEGFCYYHYWFAGRQILQRPFEEVLASGKPDFPFCLCWANQTWSGIWHGAPQRVLIEQTYPGEQDHRTHFTSLLPAFLDPRHVRIEGKPLFILFSPHEVPGLADVLRLWRSMAADAGLPGLHLVANTHEDDAAAMRACGFDGVIRAPVFKARRWDRDWRRPVRRVLNSLRHSMGRPTVVPFSVLAREGVEIWQRHDSYPCVVHAWDNTPRSGRDGVAYTGASPDVFRKSLAAAFDAVETQPAENQLVFLKSWNEWAEGNHLEPDMRYGDGFLQAIKEALEEHHGASAWLPSVAAGRNVRRSALAPGQPQLSHTNH